MIHYKDNNGEVHGFSEDQQALVNKAIASGWNEIPVFPIPLTDAEILAQAKADKLAVIISERDSAEIANVIALGATFQADAESQDLLTKAVMRKLGGGALPPEWRDINNVMVAINTLADLMAIVNAIGGNVQLARTTSFARKEALIAAVTLADVEAV